MSWGAVIGAAGAIGGGLLGSKGSSKSGGVNVPKWYSDSARGLASFGRGQAMQPYAPPPVNRVAPFSPDTMAAFDMVRQGVGEAQPYYQQALGTTGRLQNFRAPTVNAQMLSGGQFGRDIGAYMNPYTNSVVDASLTDLERQRQIQNQQLSSQGEAASAYGGDRFGVESGQFNAQALQDKSLLAAQLRSAGFEGAAQRTMQAGLANQQAGLTAGLANQQGAINSAEIQARNAFGQGALASDLAGQGRADAASVAGIGAAQEAKAQQGLDVGYQNWQDRYRTYPAFQTGLWQNALGPGAATIAGQGTSSGGGFLGALGGAQLGAQAATGVVDWWRGLQQPGAGGTSVSPWSYGAAGAGAAPQSVSPWSWGG